jgi:hypothetical protein
VAVWLVRFDVAVDVFERAAVWSHTCGWPELALGESTFGDAQARLLVPADWSRRWTAAARFAGGDVVVPVQDLASVPLEGGSRFGGSLGIGLRGTVRVWSSWSARDVCTVSSRWWKPSCC